MSPAATASPSVFRVRPPAGRGDRRPPGA